MLLLSVVFSAPGSIGYLAGETSAAWLAWSSGEKKSLVTPDSETLPGPCCQDKSTLWVGASKVLLPAGHGLFVKNWGLGSLNRWEEWVGVALE